MKPKIDTHSIKFKTWLYFILFAAALMLALWVIQVLLLNNFYGAMKTAQTQEVAQNIETSFKHNDNDAFLSELGEISNSYDMYIFVVSYDGKTTYFKPTADDYAMGHAFMSPDGESNSIEQKQYISQIRVLNEKMMKAGGSAQIKFKGEMDSQEILAYGNVLQAKKKTDMIVYIFSPLWPVSSTIKILKDQLIIVTVLSLIIACLVSFYLSFRITKPIRKIEASAKRLAEGEYGIVFRGGHYTELINLADTLTGASIELEKSDMLQKDLIANVSHDLRTPLTMIKSYAEMIRDISGENSLKRDEHLQVIIDETDRLNNLVGDLLTVSKMQSGKMLLNKSGFDLTETINTIANTYRVIEDEGYTINVNSATNYTVYADEEKIKQVVSNLLSNAIKFCGENKTVDVNLTKHGHFIRCSIEDNGCGISASDLEHVWDRYYRASSNTVRSSEGSGLGLSICKEILTLHKVDFGVYSTLNKGSRFWFEVECCSARNNKQ